MVIKSPIANTEQQSPPMLSAQQQQRLKVYDISADDIECSSSSSNSNTASSSRSDHEIHPKIFSSSADDPSTLPLSSVDQHVAAIVRARQAIRDAIDMGSPYPKTKNSASNTVTSPAATSILIRARQQLRHIERQPEQQPEQQQQLVRPLDVVDSSKNEPELSNNTSNVSSSHIIDINPCTTATIISTNPNKATMPSDISDTSSTEQTDSSSSSDACDYPATPTTSTRNEYLHPTIEEVVVVVSSPILDRNDDLSTCGVDRTDTCNFIQGDTVEVIVPTSGYIVSSNLEPHGICNDVNTHNVVEHPRSSNLDTDIYSNVPADKLLIDVTSNNDGLVIATSSEYWTPDSSYDAMAVSPLMLEKVGAYIDNSYCNKHNKEPQFLENNSFLATTESASNTIDLDVLQHASLHVREYIDSMATYDKVIGGTDDDQERKCDVRHDSNNIVDANFQVQPGTNSMEVHSSTHATVEQHSEIPVDDLVTYISNLKFEGNQTENSLNPPHSKNDPPLKQTVSEETRCALLEPETNPIKEINADDDHSIVNAPLDPEIAKSIMLDELGEPNTVSICATECNDASNPVPFLVEKVMVTPQRIITLLTLPNELKERKSGVQSSNANDPDGIYPANDLRDFAAEVRNLNFLLSSGDDADDNDIHLFGQLIRFSFSYLNSLEITSFGVSQILTRAKELDVSLAIVDRYLDAFSAWHVDTDRNLDELDNVNGITTILRDLCAHLEMLSSNNGMDFDAEDPECLLNENRRMPTDAFEVEVNDGFINNEFRPSGDDEPWWEVAARLNGTLCSTEIYHATTEEVDTASSNTVGVQDNQRHETNVSDNTSKSTFENDVVSFWKDHEESQRLKTEHSNMKRSKTIDVRNIGTSSSFSSFGVSKRELSRTVSRTRSQSSARSFPQISKRDTQRSWSSRLSMANGTSTTGKVISAVSAATALLEKENSFRKQFPFSSLWRLSYARRTNNHEGYFDVDVYSLYASTVIGAYHHPLDNVPWESRSVKQRFLHEHSVSFMRNWFGCLTAIKANIRIKEPICRPKSMEMPMEADEWTEEWYKHQRAKTGYIHVDNNQGEYDSDEDSWEDTPECGKIKNVRLRPGERITRVTPDLTCYLRRSRWRKKHFPQGNFPYG
jgi:hypothetical protein